MKEKLISLLPDVLMVAGATSVSYGFWLIYQPAGYLAGGAFALAAGLLLAKGPK